MVKRKPFPIIGKHGDKVTRLYPNGECVVYRQRIKKIKPVDRSNGNRESEWLWSCWQLYLTQPASFAAACLLMGLSLVRNFDKLASPLVDEVSPSVKVAGRYGGNGITRQGARTVRCAAHLMQKTYGSGRLTFATVTVPDMPAPAMARLHENWNKVVELYRLNIRRELQDQDLSGEIITVSEIQEKREKKSGLPVLHLHSIWVGRKPYGGWAVSTKRHDDIWRRAIKAVLPKVRISFKAAANLQEVHTSASGYLGKYMSKGAACVKALVEKGFGGWMPRQWWNCTRSLSRWVKHETLTTGEFSEFLLDAGNCEGKHVWEFVGHVVIDIGDKQDYWLATYGRLNTVIAQEIRDYIRLTN